MTSSTKQWVALIAIAIIALGGYLYPHLNNKPGSTQSQSDITTSNFTSVSAQNGLSLGGIFITPTRITALTQATTTVCAIQSPNATTTIMSASLLETVSSTTASTITLATSTTAFATTSLITTAAIGANAQGVLTWDSGANNGTVSPNTWLVFGQSGGTGTFSPTGVCSVLLQSIQ